MTTALLKRWREALHNLQKHTTSKWEISRLEQCIRELEAEVAPKPLSSAPKEVFDGREVIVRDPTHGIHVAYFYDGLGWRRRMDDFTFNPTHYLDLPNMEIELCPDCGGNGWSMGEVGTGLEDVCPTCSGSGEKYKDGDDS